MSGTETRRETCPQCRAPDAVCTHGIVDGHGQPMHEWDCPTCGESTAMALTCPTCEAFAGEVAIHGIAEIEAVLPGPYYQHEGMTRPFTEVVLADAKRRWMIACNGFSLVVHPFSEDCALDETGIVKVDDIAAVRPAIDGETFHMPVQQPVDDYPDVERIIQQRVLDRKFRPIAVLDGEMLAQIAKALRHSPNVPPLIALYASQPTAENEEEPAGKGVLVISLQTDPEWEGRPWGYLMECHCGRYRPEVLLDEVVQDAQKRMKRKTNRHDDACLKLAEGEKQT